jgi:hypothetical protein
MVHSETPHCWATSPKLNEVLSTAVLLISIILLASTPILTDEGYRVADSPQALPGIENATFNQFARRLTARCGWDDVWDENPDQDPPILALKRMRDYLRRFWEARNDRARDWHIYRAREYYQRRRAAHETRQEREFAREAPTKAEAFSRWFSGVEPRVENVLDQPPPRTKFGDLLFALQRRARKPSLAPRLCPNADCAAPYFLSKKKSQKFCSPECARPSLLQNKRDSYHKRRTQ